MSTWWWVALVAVVGVALVASVVDGRARAAGSRRRRRGAAGRAGTRPPGRPRGATGPGGRVAPRPGEIWWADVPYEEARRPSGAAGGVSPGDQRAKDRPCLVLAVRGGSVKVAKITTKYHGERPGVIALAPGTVDDALGRTSFLETDELREVRVAAFRRRVGDADPALWDRVRHLAG